MPTATSSPAASRSCVLTCWSGRAGSRPPKRRI